MGYRETYFNHTQPILGKYRCCKCGGWFNKSMIDVDHIIPKRHGGTDDISNLQGLCQHCNRSKQDNVTPQEVVKSMIGSTINGNLDEALKGIATQKAKDIFGIPYKRK